LLHKSLLLTALATGNRGSEIAAFRREGYSLRLNGTLVLAVKPGFLYKNQTALKPPPAVTIRPLPRDTLCPVANLLQYMKISACSDGALFVHPDTRRPLNRGNISARVCALIREADPDGVPQLHDLRRAAVSLAWTRGLPTEDIVQSAFWSSSSVFVKRYLKHCTNVKCVALNTV
jgi:hypothetical protein